MQQIQFSSSQAHHNLDPNLMPQMATPPQMPNQGQSPSDTWSNASVQAVPMTMNVEDW